MSSDDLTQKAREVVLAALDHEDPDVRLRAAALVLARPSAAASTAKAEPPKSAVLIVELDEDRTLKRPPRELVNEAAPAADYDPDNWTQLQADD
jgi:hypothetical protein